VLLLASELTTGPDTMQTLALIGAFAAAIAIARVRARHQRIKRETPFVQILSQSLSQYIIRIGDKQFRFELTLPPDTIEPLFSGAAWAGTVVWPASVFLANHIALKGSCKGASVIELGAGVGIPGIAAGQLGARKVILTEQPPLSELLERNVRSLCPEELRDGKYAISTLDWTEPIPNSVGEVDLILISDCIYEGLYGESWRALAVVLDHLLTKSNRALNCVERRKEDGIDRFMELCKRQYSIQSTLIQSRSSPERITELYEMRRL